MTDHSAYATVWTCDQFGYRGCGGHRWRYCPAWTAVQLAERGAGRVILLESTVTPDGGEPREIGVGDVAVFPLGWSGTWEIHETVRKVYSIF